MFVKSRWRSDIDSGRNSARAIAPGEVRCVEDRKRRLRELFKVKAVRRDWIYRAPIKNIAMTSLVVTHSI